MLNWLPLDSRKIAKWKKTPWKLLNDHHFAFLFTHICHCRALSSQYRTNIELVFTLSRRLSHFHPSYNIIRFHSLYTRWDEVRTIFAEHRLASIDLAFFVLSYFFCSQRYRFQLAARNVFNTHFTLDFKCRIFFPRSSLKISTSFSLTLNSLWLFVFYFLSS